MSLADRVLDYRRAILPATLGLALLVWLVDVTVDTVIFGHGWFESDAHETYMRLLIVGAVFTLGLLLRFWAGRSLSLADEVKAIEQGARMTADERSRLAAAIEQTDDAVVLTDPEGLILFVNPAFERISGYSRGEALGLSPRVLKSGRHRKDFYADLWDTILAGRTWRGRMVNRRKDGGLYHEDSTISPVQAEDGRLLGFVAVKRDVTAATALEERLRNAQRREALGQITAGLAHHLNNLLGTIQVGLDLARLESGEEADRALGRCEVAVQNASSLMSRLMHFTHGGQGQFAAVDLGTCAEEVVQICRAGFGRRLAIDLTVQPGVPSVVGDAAELKQALLGLLLNARDAVLPVLGPERGRISVKVEVITVPRAVDPLAAVAPPGEYVRICVADDGVGMDAEVRRRIFLPFFTTKDPPTSTGLGLANLHATIDDHGGWIDVRSEKDGGTRFAVHLPCEASSGSPAVHMGQEGSISTSIDTPSGPRARRMPSTSRPSWGP